MAKSSSTNSYKTVECESQRCNAAKTNSCNIASSHSAVYMSFGGLLMKLVGDPRNLEGAEMDARLYILMKRIVR